MKKFLFIFLDIIIVLISTEIALLLRFDFIIPEMYHQDILDFTIIATVLTVFFSLILGSYNSILAYFGFSELIRQFFAIFLTFIMFLGIKYTTDIFISGSITVLFSVIYFLLSSGIRALPRLRKYLASKNVINRSNNKKILIIGAGSAGAMVIKQMLNNNDESFPVGILDDDETKHGQKIAGTKVLGNIDNASHYATKLDVDEILIAIPSLTEGEMQDIFEKVSNANLPTKIFQTAVDIDNYNNGDKHALKEISIEDLLFRKPIYNDNRGLIENKVVLVTGGAGSIGSELCRQVLENNCKQLIICDIHENGLFEINEELKNLYKDKYELCLGSVREEKRIQYIFDKYNPQIVIHAAAHKHVPMMEINPFEAVKNNILGTLNVAKQAKKHGCEKLILISTDKAVNPTNVMGATKRVCELIIKSYNSEKTEMVAVRFGNVLGSNGSVIPVFKRQIQEGGPVTVTDKEMTRYFMTIKEAVSLVLTAGYFAKGGELFVLDMGKPVKILDLAINLIRLSGRVPFKDIDIIFTGLRPGEKLYEELMLDSETIDNTSHEKIFIMRDNNINLDAFSVNLEHLIELAFEQSNTDELRKILFETIDNNVLNA